MGQVLFDLVVVLDAGLGRDVEHLAGAEPTPLHGAVAAEVDSADLRCAHDQAVLADGVAQGAEAVAVEGGPHADAVGEDEAGGAVPWLHERGVIAVEAAHGRVEVAGVLPGLGDEHRHRVAQAPTAADEQLQGGVELTRVAGVRVEQGSEQLLGAEPGGVGAQHGS